MEDLDETRGEATPTREAQEVLAEARTQSTGSAASGQYSTSTKGPEGQTGPDPTQQRASRTRDPEKHRDPPATMTRTHKPHPSSPAHTPHV